MTSMPTPKRRATRRSTSHARFGIKVLLSGILVSMLAGIATPTPTSAHGSRHPVIKEERRYIRTHTLAPDTPETYGGPYELTDHNGRVVTDKTFHGKWAIYFFGYTGCREACPLGLEHITQSLELLGPDAEKIDRSAE